MRILIIIFSAIISIACAQASLQSKNVIAPKNQTLANTVETKSQTKSFQMPNIETVSEADIWRISENKDQHGGYLPPWTEVKVPFFYLEKKPAADSKVTVVPLEVNIASFDWQIAKFEEKEAGCDDTKPTAWEVELKPFTQREFFEIESLPNRSPEFPFDVVVLYPAVEFARQVKKEQITKQMLPKGTSINAVKAAIDVTNDQKPDVLLLKYCCQDATKSTDCDYTCGKLFKQVNGKWKLIDEYQPC
jgi:hypothetical protein